MKVIVTKNYEEMSASAADILADVIKNKPDCVLGLATGGTPVRLYELLAGMNAAGDIDFSAVSSVNLDEYYPISPENPQSYRYFMDEKLFDKVNINRENTYIPNGQAEDIAAACLEYEKIIDDLGGIDVQILGIGRNGHIGFNEPAEELSRFTHLTELTADTIKANSRFFSSEEQVPTHAITMGMASIFKARKVVLLASGKNKSDAIAKLLGGAVSSLCPATLLCLHPDLTVICDEDAYSKVSLC